MFTSVVHELKKNIYQINFLKIYRIINQIFRDREGDIDSPAASHSK